ncbi:YybH family protein [Cellulomonas sp. NS3]|uniref:YybH family protein n=1 Tax=Cellulomonas sp. NS3 TaxID=2973977 RepID=UPI002162A83B|nr:nuclear transport factor 2 family protein [Cellulomonas sp. NS3]
MDAAAVMEWVERYESAWRDDDPIAVERLFSPGAHYLRSPYEPPLVGWQAIRDFWSDDTPFTMRAEPVAVTWPVAVVRAEVHYGGDEPQEYRDLWVLRFADDGRVEHFEEWAYWPGRGYTASVAGAGTDEVPPAGGTSG